MLRSARVQPFLGRRIKLPVKYNSSRATKKDSDAKETPEELQRKKEEAAKLAMQSFKDIGTMFSGSSEDKETEAIDSQPIFEDPKKFKDLSLLHQGQILQELQNKFDKNWNKLTLQDKLLGYYIYYGNWGPRKKFSNWNSSVETPFDLPFDKPIRTSTPKPQDQINLLPEVKLLETDIRKDQFDSRRMDNVTKFFIYLTLLVALLALMRDKKIGEDGKPQEVVIRDVYEEERQRLQEEEEKRNQEQNHKKWYYLYLK